MQNRSDTKYVRNTHMNLIIIKTEIYIIKKLALTILLFDVSITPFNQKKLTHKIYWCNFYIMMKDGGGFKLFTIKIGLDTFLVFIM